MDSKKLLFLEAIDKETNILDSRSRPFLLAIQGFGVRVSRLLLCCHYSEVARAPKEYSNTRRLPADGIVCLRVHEVTGANLHIRICGRVLLKYLPVCPPLERTQTAARIHIVDTRDSVPGFRARVSTKPCLNFIIIGSPRTFPLPF